MKTKTNTLSRVLSFLMVLCMVLSMVPMAFAATTVVTYEKVTSAPTDWSGTYLIVYEKSETEAIVHNGSDGFGLYETAVINNGTISSTSALTACEATIATMDGGYSVYIGGNYIYGTAGSNKTNTSSSAQLNTIAMDENGSVLITSNTSVLRFNNATTSGNNRFRYYKSTSYTSQQPVYLYAKVETEVSCDHQGTATNTVGAKDATCTEAGYTGDVICECGVTVETGSAIDALGHNLVAGEVTAPDCINTGYTTYACDREGCGYREKADITEALGHSFVNGTCSVCNATEGTVEKASAIAVGDTVVFVIEDASVELTAISTTSTPYGLGTAYTGTPAGTWQWEVVAGSAEGTYAFKNSDGNYLYWSSGNSLNVNASLSDNTSWTVTFDTDGNAVILNFKESARQIWWNTNNGTNPRFACYTGKSANTQYLATQIYKISASADACEHSWSDWTVTKAATCSENGEQTRSCSVCLETETAAIATVPHTVENGSCTLCGAEYYALATALNNYDNLVIYYPTAGSVMTATASGTKLAGTSAAVSDYGMEITSNMAVLQVQYLAGSTTDFYLVYDNMYLTSGATGNSLTFAAEVSDYAVWYLETADETGGLVYIHNRNASYNGGSQSMEYYNGFTTYGTNTTAAYQFQLFTKAGEVPACEHSWGQWATTTEATCTEDGVQTSICSLCEEARTQSIAAKGHSYSFGDTAAACSACDVQIAKSSISDVKNFTADTIYYFEGVVTYVSGRTTYMEDATGGICVYYAYNEQQGVALGDTIRVCDSIKNYNGLLETTDTLAAEIQRVSTDNVLPCQTVTIAELNADKGNQYLGQRVVIRDVTIGTINTSGSTALTDADGNTIDIYKASGLAENIAAGDTVTVTAIVSSYNGYQLILNPGTAATDVVEAPEIVNAAVYQGGQQIGGYATVEEAYAAYTAGTQYIQLLADAQVTLQLTKDLYIDLNGHCMEGTIDVGTCKIYGMDSATNEYGDSEGYMDCSATNGSAIQVDSVFTTTDALTGAIRSYMAIEGDNGWSFNRFYLGITHISLNTANTGIGYKAVFYGNKAVCDLLSQTDTFGYTLSLDGGNTVTRTLDGITSGKVVTLRISNYDIANYGETALSAKVTLKLADGTLLESAVASTSMKTVVETLNTNAASLTETELAAASAFVKTHYETMKAWNISSLYTEE